MKPIDVESKTCIEFDGQNNNEGPKFEDGDQVRIWKFKNIFAKGYPPKWSEDIFVIKNTVLWTYVIEDLKGVEGVGTLYEKELQKADQTEFRMCQMERLR